MRSAECRASGVRSQESGVKNQNIAESYGDCRIFIVSVYFKEII